MLAADRFEPARFDSLPGWAEHAPLGAFEAFRRSAFHALYTPYRTGSLGIEFAAFGDAYAAARQTPARSDDEARLFFERFFRPALVRPDTGKRYGHVTGFYEPNVGCSPRWHPEFQVPLLAKPHDLVPVNGLNRPAGMDASFEWARQTPAGLVPFYDRAEIENGALADRPDLPIAWLADPVEAFFIHVQGSARLRLPEKRFKRLTYAAKSGHPFTGPGRVLLEMGELPPGGVTMQSIREWFKANPHRVREILHKNRSYIFFREAVVEDESLGPVAAAKVPLTPGRSVAVDKHLHTFGTPFFISAPLLYAFERQPFSRLMIAQDTGSAILGAARGDLFAGSGDIAGAVAGVVNHEAVFTALLPLSLWQKAGW
ncbi:MAG: transglycosylase [Mesorhizobium amorphae]|nr:MAG: transglycosylase [Mesorhizobium amorphae]